ncbi:ATPase family protein associated with various cellular activities (AAA) [Chitinophaga dinghuensis]|uniref:ATPase family protein associated with various cellular activities (AAA) n=1 Tax=Chitinophaga dinghuensis TaxID=1539050 RepID=A0A327VVX6_9BACT|nr:ATP-binding protein [Chitinophaga dinghuensis]RAJ79056.1 ATPase family protein associated with various cellular activities (AAA) [Chitinophaga dinghuensis]
MSIFDLIIIDPRKIALEDVFFSDANKAILEQVIKEHRHIDALRQYELPVDNKILLHGQSGCGKTTTAKAIAAALGKSIVILNLSTLVSSKLGETSHNLKTVFDKAIRDKAVLFLDEFDQIGKLRSTDDHDSGEMRRLVNTLLQLVDYFPQDSMLVCATNFYDLIDPALLRRFQLKLKYELPGQEMLDLYYEKKLERFPEHLRNLPRKYDISYAEAEDYINTTMKGRIIQELETAALELASA